MEGITSGTEEECMCEREKEEIGGGGGRPGVKEGEMEKE